MRWVRARPASAAGIALPAVLLLVLAITALAHAALVLADAELAVSRASATQAVHGAAAEGAIESRLAAGWTPPREVARWHPIDVPPPSAGPARATLRALRVGREAWLLEAAASSPGRSLRSSVVWSPTPEGRVAAWGGGLRIPVGAPLSGAPGTSSESPAGRPQDCEPWLASLDSLLPGGALRPIARGAAEGLGLMGWDTLLARLPVLRDEAGSPAPVEAGGRCTDAPWNWGHPADPSSPCAGRRVALAAAGSLVLQGGLGQGLLVAGGDLALEDGAYFDGVALVQGSFTLSDSARVRGVVVAQRAHLGAQARIVGSSCSAVLALEAAMPWLAPAARLPGGRWVE